ncbi:uncharacterized protein LOC129587569 [Paramacrobiotus metropolitanus]|uniref:uncharacterized protein LOC129587569 n=1 Tax=Paramacrobiotus metropolitanus TaxID=2943436 RepID=UPI00244605EE|nr:uncharacterized protein LOC129587569 [Paramacrobiotus metropolitanus]
MMLYCAVLVLMCAALSQGVMGPLRVEVELRRLNNSQGILHNGKMCDLTSSCDHRITGYFDTDRPMDPWPGMKAVDQWTLVFEKDNDNVPIVNKIVSRDVCEMDIQRANLRLNVVDVDSLTKNDLVEQFECMVPVENNVATNINRAFWSTERACSAKFNPDKIRLNYRYRVFGIAPTDCGKPPAGASSKPAARS